MIRKHIGYCFHPTTVILVDDDEEYLHFLEKRLNDDFILKSFTNPVDALKWIKKQYADNPFLGDSRAKNISFLNEDFDTFEEEDIPSRAYLGVDIKEIHEEIYSSDRFKVPSVVVVDQNMPAMKGLDFCVELKKFPLKKLMLTGVATTQEGLNAFNEGKIDGFVSKGEMDKSFADKLIEFTAEMQQQYFADLSTVVVEALKQKWINCFADHDFIKFFADIRKKHHIVEYYLVGLSASF